MGVLSVFPAQSPILVSERAPGEDDEDYTGPGQPSQVNALCDRLYNYISFELSNKTFTFLCGEIYVHAIKFYMMLGLRVKI